MKIAVLSGKGGAGKTLVSVNLAAAANTSAYIDCDVEEPNGRLFLKPEGIVEEENTVKIPQVDTDLCDGCRRCVDFCIFNALAFTNRLLVFDDICHSCGGCVLVCPNKAFTERDKAIGRIQTGSSNGIEVITGILNTGEPSGVPLINELMKKAERLEGYVFIDCPPGSACTVMESIKDADYCILVAEPTLFGVHNLNMVYELVRLFNKPFGAVINKCLEGEENPAETFCRGNGIEVLCSIPFDSELGELNSNAEIAVYKDKKYRGMFVSLLERIKQEVKRA